MFAPHHKRAIHSLILATAFLILPARPSIAGQEGGNDPPNSGPFEITLTLVPVSSMANRFAVEAGLDPLVPGRGMESAAGSVDWTGEFKMNLYLDQDSPYGMPVLEGVELVDSGAGVEQSRVNMHYGNLPVDVQFEANDIRSRVAATSSAMVLATGDAAAGLYNFAAGQLYVMQMDGQAGVSVQTRPGVMQTIENSPIAMAGPSSAATFVIEPIESEEARTYRATFRMPMANQMVAYSGTGLPVDFRYLSGDLVASGEFVLGGAEVPEPSSVVLAVVACAAAMALRARACYT